MFYFSSFPQDFWSLKALVRGPSVFGTSIILITMLDRCCPFCMSASYCQQLIVILSSVWSLLQRNGCSAYLFRSSALLEGRCNVP